MKYIWVTFQKEGIHRYPEALTNPELEDVKFLGYDHRHIFHFRVDLEVRHDNRDVEFIQMKRWLESLYQTETVSVLYGAQAPPERAFHTHLEAENEMQNIFQE